MKYVFISDLHIKTSDDEAALLLKKFIKHSKTLEAQYIYFLGDIFDLMIGEHKGYTKKFDFFYRGIADLLDAGKEVVFIEGNHDFHFQNTIKRYLERNCKQPESFRYLRAGEEKVLNGEKYFICHGYEVDYNNKYFKRWYKIYSSGLFNFFLSYILTFSLIQKLGEWASNNSKKRGKKTFNYEKMKAKYIDGARDLISEKQVKGIIAGHTHVDEFYTYEDKTIYLNCGFPVHHHHFICFDGVNFEKVNLN